MEIEHFTFLHLYAEFHLMVDPEKAYETNFWMQKCQNNAQIWLDFGRFWSLKSVLTVKMVR